MKDPLKAQQMAIRVVKKLFSHNECGKVGTKRGSIYTKKAMKLYWKSKKSKSPQQSGDFSSEWPYLCTVGTWKKHYSESSVPDCAKNRSVHMDFERQSWWICDVIVWISITSFAWLLDYGKLPLTWHVSCSTKACHRLNNTARTFLVARQSLISYVLAYVHLSIFLAKYR